MVLDSSKSAVFRYLIKHSFIYLLVPVLSLENIRLCIMCAGTIAGQRSIEGYIALCLIICITSHYFDSCMAAAFRIL